MYVERTNYWARPGQLEDVVRIRKKASAVRADLDLPVGTISYKVDQDNDGPDVTWECPFPTVEARRRDLAARAASPRFEAVRAEMGQVIARFERHFLRHEGASMATAWPAADHLEKAPIVPRELTFRSGDDNLTGFLFLPPGTGPLPCMVYNHGSGVDKDSQDLCKPAIAATLMSWGIAGFIPHRRGYGRSPGPGWREEVTGEFGTEAYDIQLVARLDRESDDVVAALDFLQSRPEIQADRIGVMGSSFGGINTLLAAAKTDRFRCAVEFAGAAMNWERTPKLREHMLSAAVSLTRPIFFIQAENDFSTGPTRELSAAMESAGKRVKARVFPPFGLTHWEGHLFERSGTMIWGPEVRRFLERWL